MANRTRGQLSSDSLLYFPNNSSQEITPQDLRDWITNGIESFVTQKDKSTFENAFYENRGNAITATSGTTDLSLANGNFVHITGTTPPPPAININSFGLLPAGSRFVLCFDIPVTLVYNATSLIIPGAANVTTAAGDCIMLISEGSGNWRVISYFPGGGLPVGTITGVTAGTGLSGGGTSGTVTVSLGNITPDPSGSFTNANVTVDAQGRITAASSGTGGSGITALTGDVTASGTGSVAATISNGAVDIPMLSATGTPDSTTFLRGDNTWQTPPGGGGGSPGGSNGDYQFKNGGAFDGNNQLRYASGFVVAHSPKIGDSNSTGHFHMHSANSAPTGINNYLTMFWQVATRALGFRSETDTHETYIQLTAPTADRTITLPDASGNVVIDSTIPSFNNGSSEGEIRLREATANGTNYIGLKAPATTAADTTFTLPNADGTPGTVLQTNGSGILSWVNNGGVLSTQYLKNSNTTNVITNPAATTILETLIIPAGTYSSNNGILLNVKLLSTIATTAIGYGVNINTSAAVGGQSIISSSMAATSFGQNVVFGLNLYGGLNGNTTRFLASPFVPSTALGSAVTTIDWSITQYVVVFCNASTNRNVSCVLIATSPI
jgi:hypothetical protein